MWNRFPAVQTVESLQPSELHEIKTLTAKLAPTDTIMDAAGLALALIDLCGKLYTYARSVKDGPREVAKLADELRALQDTLERVRVVLEPAVLTKLKTQITECLEGLRSLDAKVQPPSHREKFKQWLTRLEWPLKEQETEGYVAAIQRLQGSLSLELLAHQMLVPVSGPAEAKQDADCSQDLGQGRKQATEYGAG